MLFDIVFHINQFSVNYLSYKIYKHSRSIFNMGMCCLFYSVWDICNHTNCRCEMFRPKKLLFHLWLYVFIKCNYILICLNHLDISMFCLD